MRMRLASNDSNGCDSSNGRSSSSSAPSSGATFSSCAMRCSVARCSARASAPRHLRLFVPGEDGGRLLDVVDLGETAPQLGELLSQKLPGLDSNQQPSG